MCCWWCELYTTKCNLTSHFFRILADLVLMVYCLFLFCYFLEQEYLTGVDLFQSERHLLAFTLITNLARTQTYRGTSESTPGVRRYELRAPEGQFIVSLKRPREICAAVSGLVLMAINKPVYGVLASATDMSTVQYENAPFISLTIINRDYTVFDCSAKRACHRLWCH